MCCIIVPRHGRGHGEAIGGGGGGHRNARRPCVCASVLTFASQGPLLWSVQKSRAFLKVGARPFISLAQCIVKSLFVSVQIIFESGPYLLGQSVVQYCTDGAIPHLVAISYGRVRSWHVLLRRPVHICL